MKTLKRIGIVGLGLKNPFSYAPLLRKYGAEVAYVWDDAPENALEYAQMFNCVTVARPEDFPDVDGVLIDSRNCDHVPLARLFLERGIPVYIEKPLSHDVSAALNFLKESEGKPAFSASPLRFSPVYLRMLDDLRATSEAPVCCHVTVYHTMEHFLADPVKRWHDDPEKSGGILTDLGIHAVELLNLFMREPVIRVTGASTKSWYKDAHCCDNYALTFEYESGALGTIALLCATDRLDYSVDLTTPGHAFVNRCDSVYGDTSELNADNAYGGFDGTIRAFLEMIDTGVSPIDPEETRRNFELLGLMHSVLANSTKTGRTK